MKKVDKIIISIMLFVVTLAWCYYLIEIKPLAIAVTLALFMIESLILRVVYKKKGGASVSKINQQLALMGHAYTLDLLQKAINQQLSPTIEDDAIIITKDSKKELVYASVKFSQSGTEDVAKAVRLCIKKKISLVHFVSNGIDRRSLNIINSQYVKFNFITTKPFIQRLEKLSLLPEVDYKKNSAKSLKVIASIALNKKNAPRLLLVSTVLLVLSFITPLSGYYLVMATLSVVLAAICMFNSKGDNPKNNIFGKD